jgi:molybdopterin molybdotransferase
MTNATLQHGCGHGTAALSLEEALARIEAALQPIEANERLPLRATLDRILAEDVRAPIDVPGHTNSAMDGYAMRFADLLPREDETTLKCVGDAFAGHPFAGEVQRGECVRIMTGGALPAGADTVVMQEHVTIDGDRVRFRSGYRPGENVRQAGEDLARGALVLAAGKRMRPAELGLLASIGVSEVAVRRRLRVAFFSTGDELRHAGTLLAPGEIYDSNRDSIYGMLARLNVEPIDLGVVRDEPEALRAVFKAAAGQADVVIASGGVSVGAADYVKQILEELGKIDFWQIASKPGRPLAFGELGDATFFGLPGNPVSVMVTFYQVVRPALCYLMGAPAEPPLKLTARTLSQLHKRPGRREFQRGILETAADGTLTVRSVGQQGSGILSSMSKANCFIVLPETSGSVAEGAMVTVEPFAAFV